MDGEKSVTYLWPPTFSDKHLKPKDAPAAAEAKNGFRSILGNRKHGIAFRRKAEANGAHRAILRGNVIEDNGAPANELKEIKSTLPDYESIGCGIHVEGVTRDIVIEDNIIRKTRGGDARTQRRAIVFEQGVTVASLKDNAIEGHSETAVVDRTAVLELATQ